MTNAIAINPVFDDVIQHIEKLTVVENTDHRSILTKLLDEIQPIDYHEVAYPNLEKLRARLEKLETIVLDAEGKIRKDESSADQVKEYKSVLHEIAKCKVNQKHHLVLSIENVLKVAEMNKWGICKNHDFIYLYNGQFWQETDKESFQKFLGSSAQRMGVDQFTAKHFQFKELLYKQFLSTAYLPSPETDTETVLINLQNGTFEINEKGNQLRRFGRKDFITYQLPFDYDPNAKAPLFETYLNRVLPDIERQKVLAEYLGFVFIRHGSRQLKEEKALILYGSGANGKSVFFEVVSALLGSENTSNYSLQSLTNDNGYFRAKLANKLVNYASEINGKLESSIFKQLVSGEPVEARLPYGEPFTLKQYAKLIFNCNELPRDVEHTNAYFRRFLIIPFDVTIPEAEQDKQLHTKIIDSELSGVFNWVLEGLNRLLSTKRFTECGAIQDAVNKYKAESDSAKMFLDETGYKATPDAYTSLKGLYTEYRTFCVEDGFRAVNKTNFKKRLKSYNIQIDRKNIGYVAFVSNGDNIF